MFVMLLMTAPVALAQDDLASPVGRWKTIDDSSGKPRSIVQIWERNGTVYGTIRALFRDPGEDPEPLCDKCDGFFKNKPVKGMNILWGLKKEGPQWSGGRILDPENGETYRCWIEVIDGGRRLKVRGFIGFSFIGRTQIWERVP